MSKKTPVQKTAATFTAAVIKAAEIYVPPQAQLLLFNNALAAATHALRASGNPLVAVVALFYDTVAQELCSLAQIRTDFKALISDFDLETISTLMQELLPADRPKNIGARRLWIINRTPHLSTAGLLVQAALTLRDVEALHTKWMVPTFSNALTVTPVEVAFQDAVIGHLNETVTRPATLALVARARALLYAIDAPAVRQMVAWYDQHADDNKMYYYHYLVETGGVSDPGDYDAPETDVSDPGDYDEPEVEEGDQ